MPEALALAQIGRTYPPGQPLTLGIRNYLWSGIIANIFGALAADAVHYMDPTGAKEIEPVIEIQCGGAVDPCFLMLDLFSRYGGANNVERTSWDVLGEAAVSDIASLFRGRVPSAR